MNPETLKSTASAAQRSRTFQILARVGYVVLGLVHLIIGAIAISVAVGAGGGEADQGGAMEQISRVPFGTVVLWVIVLGLAALACGRSRRRSSSATRTRRRSGAGA